MNMGKVNMVHKPASQPAKFRYRIEASDKLSLCKLRAYERVRYQIAGIRELMCLWWVKWDNHQRLSALLCPVLMFHLLYLEKGGVELKVR
jgi:hypothetical protein